MLFTPFKHTTQTVHSGHHRHMDTHMSPPAPAYSPVQLNSPASVLRDTCKGAHRMPPLHSSSTPLPPGPDAPPIPDFYFEHQIAQFCKVHALNAFFGRNIVHHTTMLAFAHEQTQAQTWGTHLVPRYNDTGNFNDTVINHWLQSTFTPVPPKYIFTPLALIYILVTAWLYRGEI
jgi:hypothetical protein